MDQRLVAWARAVKARRARSGPPPLWLFTDPARMPDLPRTIALLPRGLCGVVFRHDAVPGRSALLGQVARQCRARRLAIVVAGAAAGAPPWAGRHYRGGRGPRRLRRWRTSSAHGVADLVRAQRMGVDLAFLSPFAPTASHAGARALGPVRWAALARRVRMDVAALGGIDGGSVRGLPRWAAGAGAITALVVSHPEC